jgi:putative ABC transport system ATP-binding protein
MAAVDKQYRGGGVCVAAMDDVTVEFAAGTMTAITGASGSGKSTLLHLVGTIETADRGRITVDDLEVTGLRGRGLVQYRRRIGFVFQRFHLLPALTALDNVLAPVRPYRTSFDKVARARELLDAVGLGGRERSLPGQLSGGEQQRFAIARALVTHPTLLLADEPTGALDSATGAGVLELLVSLQERFGMTALIATHEGHIAARCDRVIQLRDGRIVADRAPEAVR